MGGDDASENIVELIPEDHLFAHLCLAKAYGGKELWAAVAAMLFIVGKDGCGRYGKSIRKRYGWAVRKYQETNSGAGGSRYSGRKYVFRHKDGTKDILPQWDFAEKYGFGRPGVCLLVNGKISNYHGWYIDGNKPDYFGTGGGKGTKHPMFRSEVFSFANIDGRSFNGTMFDLCTKYKIPKSSACMLINKKRKITRGWFISGIDIDYCGRVSGVRDFINSGGGNVNYKGIKRKFKTADGEIITATLTEISVKTGIGKSTIANIIYRGNKTQSGLEYLGVVGG
jgi:hypothetical protein